MSFDSSASRTPSFGPESTRDLVGRLLYDVLAKEEGEERDGFLAELDVSHPEHAVEIRSLAHWGHLLDRFKAPVEPEAGTVLGGYELVSLLGEGGFGRVWRAKAREAGLPDVALKIVKAGIDTEAVLRRFQREREVLARLKHSGIAAIQDGGRTDGGRPYIVMERVLGEPITKYASVRGLDPEDVARLMVRVCRAVEHAHGEKVLHRDLKPSNILVAEEDNVAWPKVIDFGIASVLSDGADLGPTITEEGRPVGSPGYMSPEQAGYLEAKRAQGGFDGRTDVFALGRILFELVTGQAAVDFGTAAGPRLARLMDEAFERGNQSPRRLAQALGRPAVGQDLDAIIQHATETEPDRRYGSVAELRADLERFLDGESVEARPPGAMERGRRFGRRHRPVLLPAAVLVAGLGASLVYVTGAQRRAVHANERLTQTVAVQSELIGNVDVAAMGGDLREEVLAQLGLGLGEGPEREALLGKVARHVDFTGLARGVVERSVLDPAEAALEEQFGDDLASRQVVTATILDVRKRLGLFGGRGRTAEALHEMAVEAYGGDSLEAAATLMEMGCASFERGLSSDAEKHFQKALDMYTEVLGPKSKEGLLPRHYLARVKLTGGDHDGALLGLMEVAEDAQALGVLEGETLEGTWLMIASCHERSREFLLALEACEKAEALVAAREGADDFRKLEPRLAMARIRASLGQTKEALELLEEVLPKVRESFGDTHQRTMSVLVAAANARFQAGDVAGALEATQLLYAAQEALLTASHPETLRVMANRLKMLNVLGRYDEAGPLGEQAVQHARGSISGDNEVTGALLIQRATTLAGQARLDECMECLEEAVGVYEGCLPEGHTRRQLAYAIAVQFYTAIQGMRPDQDFAPQIAKYQAKLQ